MDKASVLAWIAEQDDKVLRSVSRSVATILKARKVAAGLGGLSPRELTDAILLAVPGLIIPKEADVGAWIAFGRILARSKMTKADAVAFGQFLSEQAYFMQNPNIARVLSAWATYESNFRSWERAGSTWRVTHE